MYNVQNSAHKHTHTHTNIHTHKQTHRHTHKHADRHTCSTHLHKHSYTYPLTEGGIRRGFLTIFLILKFEYQKHKDN